MVIAYAGLAMLALLWLHLRSRSRNISTKNISKKFYVGLCVCYLSLVSSLKSIFADRTGDLVNYYNGYYSYSTMSVPDILSTVEKDPLFWVYGKVFYDFGFDVHIWMASIAVVYAACYGVLLLRYSDNPFLSVLILVSLDYYSFTLTGLRQTMAMALIFIAYSFIIERKAIPFVLAVLLASTFHSTALAFLPAYLIVRIPVGKMQLVAIAIGLVSVFVAPGPFRNFISWVAQDSYLENYSSVTRTLSWSGYIIQAAIFGFCYYLRMGGRVGISDRAGRILDVFLNCMTVGLVFQGYSAVVAEAFRMSYYYGVCLTLALPNTIRFLDDKKLRENIPILVAGVFLLYMLYGRRFFDFVYLWQMA